jgi:tetraacyldisaccharide 4'-kinase
VWHVRRKIEIKDVPSRPVVFCGIAKPRNFVSQLRTAGIEPAAEKFYRDHHAYVAEDIHELLRIQQRNGGGGFVTTEKDAINLGPHIEKLKPMSVIPVQMDLLDAANAVDTMLSVIEERRRRT